MTSKHISCSNKVQCVSEETALLIAYKHICICCYALGEAEAFCDEQFVFPIYQLQIRGAQKRLLAKFDGRNSIAHVLIGKSDTNA
jgi:hypothetical protein